MSKVPSPEQTVVEYLSSLEEAAYGRMFFKDKKLQLSSAKGVLYGVKVFPEENSVVVTGNFSSLLNYNIFPIAEDAKQKVFIVDNSIDIHTSVSWSNKKGLVFSVSLFNSPSDKEIETILSSCARWGEIGLVYDYIPSENCIRFDASALKFTSNYLWSLSSIFYSISHNK